MIKNIIYRAFVAAVLSLGVGSALAEDIDIYSTNTTITAGAPNVLLVVDSSANWNTRYVDEKAALATIVGALKTQFNLGLMFYNESGDAHGAYVRFAVQAMTDSSGNATAARNCLLKMMGTGATCTSTNTAYTNLDSNFDKSNAGYIGLAMAEAYAYFAGINAYNGANVSKGDPLAFVNGTKVGPQYKSPVTGVCDKVFIIHISNGGQESTTTDSDGNALLTAAGGAGAAATITPPGDSNPADEWARYLNKVSTVQAITYTLEVDPVTNGQGPTYTALMQSMGRQGKGGYFAAATAAAIQSQLTRIFNDIQAVNSVFASSSLPLSSDKTGAFLNQLYTGVFRPDGQGKPRWVGNMKQYQFAVDSSSNLFLVDALGLPAAGAAGFATPDAVSFWTSKDTATAPDSTFAASTSSTTGSTGGFWFFDSKGSGLSYDKQDGEWVEKGGAAQQLRLAYLGYGNRGGIGDLNTSTLNGKAARQVYTCTGTCLTTTGTALSTTPFDASNSAITDVALGLSTSVSVTGFISDASISGTAVSGGTATISSISKSGGNAVATTSAAHGFVVGESVTITGNAYAGYNGTYAITAASATTFTYNPASTTNGGAQGGGTASTSSSTRVTVTTSSAHGYAASDKVTVIGAGTAALNGVVTVASVPSTTKFTYTLAVARAYVSNSMSVARNRATATTASAHGFAAGDSVTLAGATPVGYNGSVTVLAVPLTTTFTYFYTASAPLASGSAGTATKSSSGTAGLIKWIRGQDTLDENGFKVNGQDTDVRASIHGDVLHSRPMVLNYSASSSSNNVYIFYGGNDGVFRAIKGGQLSTDGKEQWAFIPQEFFGKFARLYNNSPQVLYPSTSSGITPAPTARDYMFDGPVGSYVERNASDVVTKAYLYIAMRRGGRFIYALDVTTPTAPKFLWKKSSSDPGFAELGQTWSQPIVAKINANIVSGVAKPVLIFGAGYDAASEDTDIPASVDTMGRAIYVLDAATGDPLWAGGKTGNFGTLPSGMTFHAVSGMDFSIAADVLVVDRTFDGYADRIYAADLGGNVWRVDIDDATPSNWTVSKIAALAERSSSNLTAARKFLYGPDVVFGDTFDAVILGSGDREHPLTVSTATNSVINRFYMVKDTNIGTPGAALGVTDTCPATLSTSCSNLFDATPATPSPVVPSNALGFVVSLGTPIQHGAGEKVVNGPIVTAGHVIFGTNQPDTSSTSCTANLGIARRYDVNYLTGLGGGAFKDANGNVLTSEVAPGGGFLPSPVSGVVEINGVPYLFTTDNPLSPGGVIPITASVTKKRFRTYWREKLE